MVRSLLGSWGCEGRLFQLPPSTRPHWLPGSLPQLLSPFTNNERQTRTFCSFEQRPCSHRAVARSPTSQPCTSTSTAVSCSTSTLQDHFHSSSEAQPGQVPRSQKSVARDLTGETSQWFGVSHASDCQENARQGVGGAVRVLT